MAPMLVRDFSLRRIEEFVFKSNGKPSVEVTRFSVLILMRAVAMKSSHADMIVFRSPVS